jgi:hypothetical protein
MYTDFTESESEISKLFKDSDYYLGDNQSQIKL